MPENDKTETCIYRWRNNSKRAALYGKRCRLLLRLPMNSAVVEFGDGHAEVISRNALKKTGSEDPVSGEQASLFDDDKEK